MRKYILYLLAILLAACSKSVPYSDETIKNDLRVPAYPLLMLHPHLRLWSTTDQLTEKNMIFTTAGEIELNAAVVAAGAVAQAAPRAVLIEYAVPAVNVLAVRLHKNKFF